MKIYLYIVIFNLLLLCADAFSLSCRNYEDKLFIECKKSGCTDLFFVKEVYSGGGCGRRPVVDSIPEAVKSIADYEIKLGELVANNGIYILTLHRPFGVKFDYSFEEYRKFKELNSSSGYYFNSLIKKESVTSHKLEDNWREKERIGYRNFILGRVADWVSLFTALVLLMFSVLCFIRWFHYKKRKYLIIWFVTQVVIFSSMFYVNVWAPPMFILVSMAVPIVWLYQIVHFMVLRFTKNRLTRPST